MVGWEIFSFSAAFESRPQSAKVTRYVTPSTVRKIHNLLKSCFHQAVQGDSGHAQAKMVTDQYSHILDDGRKENASHSN